MFPDSGRWDKGGLLRSPPCRVHMCGWESTTWQLQQYGWQLSMDQDMMHRRLRLAMRHPDMGAVCVADALEYDFLQVRDLYNPETRPTFVVRGFQAGIKVQHERGTNPMSMFKPVDATPHMLEHDIKNIEDMILFTPLRAAAQEIIIPDKDVSALLADIIQKQGPKQAEIRERIRREEARIKAAASDHSAQIEEIKPHLICHANILTFARKAA